MLLLSPHQVHFSLHLCMMYKNLAVHDGNSIIQVTPLLQYHNESTGGALSSPFSKYFRPPQFTKKSKTVSASILRNTWLVLTQMWLCSTRVFCNYTDGSYMIHRGSIRSIIQVWVGGVTPLVLEKHKKLQFFMLCLSKLHIAPLTCQSTSYPGQFVTLLASCEKCRTRPVPFT